MVGSLFPSPLLLQIPFFLLYDPYGEIDIAKFCPRACGEVEGVLRVVGVPTLIDLSVTYYDGILVDAERATAPCSMSRSPTVL